MAKKKSLRNKFFKGTRLQPKTVTKMVQDGLKGADYGELYQEISSGEQLVKDKGVYTVVSIGNGESGFGFRVGQGARVGYSISDVFNKKALTQAIKEARQVLKGDSQAVKSEKAAPVKTAKKFYSAKNPMRGISLQKKITALDAIETYAKSLDADIVNVSLSYSASAKSVRIVTKDGKVLTDNRPFVTLSIGITVKDESGKLETGGVALGGQVGCEDVFDEKAYQEAVQKALKQAKDLLIAEEAPAGVMDVVLANGWNAVVLHEAIGHGLEGDFNRKGSSVYSGKVGQLIAAPEVTVIDQGNMPGERGSIHFDDEGTPSRQNVLIENGVLKGYMQDRQNAQLMGVDPTGNGRRQSYKHAPMPRMTNTYFANGTHNPEDIIKSVKDGLYVTDMGGGNVDITSGKFNFRATIAYRIRDGKICEPVKGATLVGFGDEVIKSIMMVGNDLDISKTRGVCGKNGQSVVVGCGQPTIRVSNMTVGGTKK